MHLIRSSSVCVGLSIAALICLGMLISRNQAGKVLNPGPLKPEAALEIAKTASKTVAGEIAVHESDEKFLKFQEKFERDSHYPGRLETFLLEEPDLKASDLELSNARNIASDLVDSLKEAGISKNRQMGILNAVGKHFYNRSVISERQGISKAVKVKFLKLAIAHLDKGRAL